MASHEFGANPHFREYETHLLRLHQLFREGKGDSAEAEALRDQMEVPGSWLSPAEADRLGGLSGDLYMLENDEIYEEVEGSEQARLLAEELQATLVAGQWERSLELLRKRPASAAPARVAELRAIAYHRLGQPAAAVEFARYAVDHDPRSYAGKFMVLDLLDELGKPEGALAAALHFSVDGTADAWWLVRYTGLLLCQPQHGAQIRHWRKVRAYLDWILQRPAISRELPPEVRFFATLSLAIAHDQAGDVVSAQHWQDRFLSLEPPSEKAREIQARLRTTAVDRHAQDRWTLLDPELLSGVSRQTQILPSGSAVFQVAA